jgi:hypothetical protein
VKVPPVSTPMMKCFFAVMNALSDDESLDGDMRGTEACQHFFTARKEEGKA